jgi:carboxypeptidase C (cathepsin A)
MENFRHIDPTGAEKGGAAALYTAGDLAASMTINPYFKVFSANGYFDAVTPYFQTLLRFEKMPLANSKVRENLIIRNYPSGHMIYLDGPSPAAMRSDLVRFYGDEGDVVATPFVEASDPENQRKAPSSGLYSRRFGRTPY